jgi:uncharacterized protein (TIGR03066 family)
MKILATVFAGIMTLGFTTAATAADDTKKLLVGKWEVVKADEMTLPVGAVVEFSADGKLKVTAKIGGKEESHEGTYTAEEKSFTYKMKVNDNEVSNKITIKKITESDLETVNPENKNVTLKKTK